MLHPGARPVHAISGCPLEDIPLLTQDLVLTPQPLQLSGHVLLAIPGRMVDLMLAPAIEPVPQGRQADPEILGDLASGSTAGLSQPDRFIPEFLRKASVGLGHGAPPGSRKCSPLL